MRFFTEELFYELLYFRDTGRTTYQDHLINIGGFITGIFKRRLTRFDAALEEVITDLLKLGFAKFLYQVLWYIIHCHNVWQVYFSFSRTGKFDLCFFSGFFQAL